MDIVTSDEINSAHKISNAYKKIGVEFNFYIRSTDSYPNRQYLLKPFITKIDNIRQLTELFIVNDSFYLDLNQFQQNQDNRWLLDMAKDPHVEHVTDQHTTITDSSVKYFPKKNILSYNASRTGDYSCRFDMFYIKKAPTEIVIDNHTYRILVSGSEVIACVNETNPLWQYLDKGFILLRSYNQDKRTNPCYCVVLNQLTLETVYTAIAFAIDPSSVIKHATKQCFIHSAQARVNLIKIEKDIPAKKLVHYNSWKDLVIADFEANAQNLMISKLQRNEVSSITLNDIKLTQTGASYETVSIDAADFRQAVFRKINPNDNFDIYTLVNAYCDYIENQFSCLPVNDSGTAFLTEKKISFKINEIPITVGVGTSHTRRFVNDICINKDELSRVLRRASCFHSLDEYNQFLESVCRMSLMMHDVLANGLPAKTYIFDNERDLPAEGSLKHPKFRFKKDQYKLKLVRLDGTTFEIKRPVEFVRAIYAINRQALAYYYPTHEGKMLPRYPDKPNWAETEIRRVLAEHLPTVPNVQLDALLVEIKKERIEAEEKSKKLLEDICTLTGAVACEMHGLKGYKVSGAKNEYFVEEATLLVHDTKSFRTICIVNGKGEQGVGQDALVTRLLALKNDSRVTKQITTLAY